MKTVFGSSCSIDTSASTQITTKNPAAAKYKPNIAVHLKLNPPLEPRDRSQVPAITQPLATFSRQTPERGLPPNVAQPLKEETTCQFFFFGPSPRSLRLVAESTSSAICTERSE